MLAPIAAAVLWMGVYPASFLAPMRADVDLLLARIEPHGHAILNAHLSRQSRAKAAQGQN